MGNNLYIGHGAMRKSYYNSRMEISDNTRVGQQVLIHSGGGVTIGKSVGISPAVKILTSQPEAECIEVPLLLSRIECLPVVIDDDCDPGVGSIILPGVTLGRGTQVGARAVVTKITASYAVVAGVPARVLRSRNDS